MEPISFLNISQDPFNEILSYLDSPIPLQLTNKKLSNAVKASPWFACKNNEIVAKFPFLAKIVKKSGPLEPLKLFMKLVNRLHDDEMILQWAKKAPTELINVERVDWECKYLTTLIDNIFIGYGKYDAQIVKAKNFKVFVETFAKAVGVSVQLQDINDIARTKIENGVLILDPEIESRDEYNHQVWNKLKKPNKSKKALSFKGLSNLSPEFAQIVKLKNLQSLVLNCCSLEQGYNVVFELHNLEELTINRCRLGELPSKISQLKNLKILSLTSNQLKDLPPEIGKLKRLKKLDLSNNELKNLPLEIGELPLEELNLFNNYLKQLPQGLVLLSKLKKLILRNNFFEDVDNISQLSSLKHLDLSDNYLENFPHEITVLFKLKKLYLAKNIETLNLEAIPSEILNKKDLDIDIAPKSKEEMQGKLNKLKAKAKVLFKKT